MSAADNGAGKSWDEMTHTERAIFISNLNQRNPALDKAIKARDLFYAAGYELEEAHRRIADFDERHALQEEQPAESFIDFAPKFLAAEDEQLEYIIPGLLPKRALAHWHGDPRTLKSFAAMDVAVAAATGTAAFGQERFQTQRRFQVLYSSQEDGASIVRPRFKKSICARGITDFPETLGFAIHRGIDFDSELWRERFFAEVTALGFELVIIDPIRSFTANADKGPAEVLPIAKFFRKLIEHGITVLVIHHDVKPPTNGPDMRRRSHRASGGAWFSVSECPCSFEKIGQGQSLVTPEDYKFSADPQPFTITYKETPGKVWLIGEDSTAEEAQSLAIDTKVLDYITAQSGASGNAIAKGIRARREAITDALERLQKAGKADSVQRGTKTMWFAKREAEV